ncbi:MAG: RNA-binding protein [Bacteroidetes bacterium HGW-Bacteroidetes-16]|jgi:ribosome-associated heat shock protein Hsp15|nr:MAG: RNA-binding protein [Bacteroidetes bacterium HGW-Bacteroidetes-16]
MDAVRIDKWLWAVRLYKTRSLAGDACSGGKVKINGQNAKPSREVKAGEIIEVHLTGIKKTVEVLQPIKNRVAAKIVADFIKDLTPPEEYERLEFMHQMKSEHRDRGTGRPTKKDRRELGKIKNDQ